MKKDKKKDRIAVLKHGKTAKTLKHEVGTYQEFNERKGAMCSMLRAVHFVVSSC